MSAFELDDYRLDPGSMTVADVLPRERRHRVPRHKPGERFLRGPIPLDWLIAAGRLTGRALHVALAIWYQAGRQRKGEVGFSARLPADLFEMDRSTATRALRDLERAGLVQVTWAPGRAPRVRLLDAPRLDGTATEAGKDTTPTVGTGAPGAREADADARPDIETESGAPSAGRGTPDEPR